MTFWRVAGRYPTAMQMRYLQALAEVASEKNSTVIFPLPLELLRPFLGSSLDAANATTLANGRPAEASRGVNDSAQSRQATGPGATPATVSGNGP